MNPLSTTKNRHPSYPTGGRRSGRRVAAGAAALAVTLGACSGGVSDGTAPSSDAGRGGVSDSVALDPAVDADLAEVGEAGSGDRAPGGAIGVDLVAASEGRQIISTANVSLTAEDADEVVASIGELVADAGGFVAGQDTSRVGGTTTTMELRVPPGEFDGLLDALAELGELRSQRIETDEVTEQVVDLESRITSAEASVLRLRELLDRSGSVADIAQVETELLARETTLETLRGQLRTIERQVALATITVAVDSEDAAPVVEEEDSLPSFLGGLSASWDALVLTLAGAAALVGVLVPWLALAALIGFPLWRLVRSRRNSPPAPSAA